MVQLTRDRHLRAEGVDAAVADLRECSRSVAGPADLDDLVERARDARFVLIGDASHGTSEYYAWRAALTAQLVDEAGFDYVAVEGDWTSCWEVNRFVKGLPDAPATVGDALTAFDRWPTWMWGNWEMAEFFEWLRLHNETEPAGERTGFYGMDVYGLYEAMHAALRYVEEHHPAAAADAREAFRCFEQFGEDAQAYGRSARLAPESCEDEVVDVLTDLQERLPEPGPEVPEADFAGEQAALVTKNAESYYRAMFGGGEDSWNVRDRHMAETLARLDAQHGADAQGVVWAHNTHLGDARATDMEARGRLNVGQLLNEEYPDEDVFAVGFGSYEGSVIAADEWEGEVTRMQVPTAKTGSYEHVFHEASEQAIAEGELGAGASRDRLLFTDRIDEGDALAEPRGHRAIGVVYRPALEHGNYVPTNLRERYDAFVHVDETRALHPVELHPDREKVPELYPSGL